VDGRGTITKFPPETLQDLDLGALGILP